MTGVAPFRPVVVVGLMGSGKTTVGTRLAAALGRRLRDSDQDLEQRYEASAAEVQQEQSTDVLHEREAAQLRDALAERPAPVIAAAASVIDDPANRALLAGSGAYVVWLDATPQVLAGRIGDGDDHRPHYHPDPETMLSEQRARRGPRFQEVANLTVDVSVADPEQAVATILASLSTDAETKAEPDSDGGRRSR